MTHDVTALAERNKRLHKKDKLNKICQQMIDLNLSVSDIVDHMTANGKKFKHNYTAGRLREINQARRAGRKQLENMEKARKALTISREQKKEKVQEVIASQPKAVEFTVDLDL